MVYIHIEWPKTFTLKLAVPAALRADGLVNPVSRS
jgi:hypothetical protein